MQKVSSFHQFTLETQQILESQDLKEADFSQVWDLRKNTTNNISFLYRPNND